MDERLMQAITDFITQRVNDLGADAPDAVAEALTEVEEQKEWLAGTLTMDQAPHFRKLENALSRQAGEEARYYYRAGFFDAVRFLMDWNGGE